MTEGLSCIEPVKAGGDPASASAPIQQQGGAQMQVARVGQKAPEFSAMAFYQGGFKRVSLSDYAGEWIMLCFYPGDFTFV